LTAVIARYLPSTERDDQGEVAMDLLTPELLAEINAVWDANQAGKITVQEASRQANELLGTPPVEADRERRVAYTARRGAR
jgi:hypothetical protein